MPEVYYDVIERYALLYRPDKDAGSRLAHTKFQFTLDEAKAFYDALSDTEINCIALRMQTIRSIFKDERQEERVIYPIDRVLMVIVLAKLCGCNTANEIAGFYKAHYLQFVCMLPEIPGPDYLLSASIINRIMRMFKADEINPAAVSLS